MKRLQALFILIASAWELWRSGFDPAEFEVDADDYDIPYSNAAEQLVVLTAAADMRDQDHNAVHHADHRRRMH